VRIHTSEDKQVNDKSNNQLVLFTIVSTTLPVNFLECTHDINQTHTISCGWLLDADVCPQRHTPGPTSWGTGNHASFFGVTRKKLCCENTRPASWNILLMPCELAYIFVGSLLRSHACNVFVRRQPFPHSSTVYLSRLAFMICFSKNNFTSPIALFKFSSHNYMLQTKPTMWIKTQLTM